MKYTIFYILIYFFLCTSTGFSQQGVTLTFSYNDAGKRIRTSAICDYDQNLIDYSPIAQFDYFPNPSTQAQGFYISYTMEQSGAVQIRLLSLDGNVISNITNELQEPGTYSSFINIPGLVPGQYFIEVKVWQHVYRYPIIVI